MPISADFSSLSDDDVMCIALQRTQHLWSLPAVGSLSFQGWLHRINAPLRFESRIRRKKILTRTLAEIEREFDELVSALPEARFSRVVDVGCGHALIGLLFWQRFASQLHLVDIEQSEQVHHGYHDQGAGYASLSAALRFLQNNGVPPDAINTTNPKNQPLALAPDSVDIMISLLSAGFHYPISQYSATALTALKPGGVLVFDARDRAVQEAMLKGFGEVRVVRDAERSTRLAAFKPN